jgi:hypothetical protein
MSELQVIVLAGGALVAHFCPIESNKHYFTI